MDILRRYPYLFFDRTVLSGPVYSINNVEYYTSHCGQGLLVAWGHCGQAAAGSCLVLGLVGQGCGKAWFALCYTKDSTARAAVGTVLWFGPTRQMVVHQGTRPGQVGQD